MTGVWRLEPDNGGDMSGVQLRSVDIVSSALCVPEQSWWLGVFTAPVGVLER